MSMILYSFFLEISRRNELCECCEFDVVNIHIQSTTVTVGSFSVSFILAKELKESNRSRSMEVFFCVNAFGVVS